MKKLLLLAGILVVGATSFAIEPIKVGEDLYWGGFFTYSAYDNNTERDLKVKATVVADLKVKTENVEFGKVAANMKGLAPKKNGSIKIEGVEGATVQVSLFDEKKQEINQNTVVNLMPTNEIDRLRGYKLYYKPEFATVTKKLKGGSKVIPLSGTLEVPSPVTAGDYSATLTTKVSYVKFADE